MPGKRENSVDFILNPKSENYLRKANKKDFQLGEGKGRVT